MQPDNPSTQSLDAEGSHDVNPSGGGIHFLLKNLYVIAIGFWINVTFCIAVVEDQGVNFHERVDVESRQMMWSDQVKSAIVMLFKIIKYV